MAAQRKVTCFITRLGPRGPELCVFEHPSAGIQLPAGTLEVDEALLAGAAREAFEETGLHDLELLGELGVLSNPAPHVETRHLLHFVATTATPDEWWVITPDGDGLCWRCHWIPIVPTDPVLHDYQQPWLDTVRADLLATTHPPAIAPPPPPAELVSDLTIEVFWALAADRALVSWIEPDAARPDAMPPDARIERAEAVAFTSASEVVAVADENGYGWGLPGGHREPGEVVLDTLRRELQEEACAELVDAELVGYLRRDMLPAAKSAAPRFDALFSARVALHDFEPAHETVARTVLAPRDARAVPGWRNPITQRFLDRAIAVERQR